MFFGLLKWMLVLGLLATGTVFLLHGLGVSMAWLHYKELEAYGIPAGVLLLVAGVALAALWPVSSEREVVTESSDSYTEEGVTHTSVTRTVERVVNKLSGPLD